MSTSPRLSVLVSVYKCSDFLTEFFLDIQKQTIFSEVEFLILDANEQKDSEDFQVISQFLHLQNLKYFHIGKCSLYEAWNKGIKLSKSNFITNWNTDDRRKSDSLEYQVQYLELNKDVDLCYGDLKISYTKNENFEDCNTNKFWPTFEGTLENQLRHNSPHCMPVWRKDVHERFGLFDESYFCASDYDMWFRILIGGGKMRKINKLVGLYYANPNSISMNKENHAKAVEEVVKVRNTYQK